MVSLAEMIAVGGDHLVHLEELREDDVGAELRAVGEVLAPTTAGQLMRRLNARQCRAAVPTWPRSVKRSTASSG